MNSCFSREATPMDELEILGNYFSTFYKRNLRFPNTLNELKTMTYFTNSDVRKRIDAIEKSYHLSFQLINSSKIQIMICEGKITYVLEYEIGENEIFSYYKDGYLIRQYDSLQKNESYKEIPNITISKD